MHKTLSMHQLVLIIYWATINNMLAKCLLSSSDKQIVYTLLNITLLTRVEEFSSIPSFMHVNIAVIEITGLYNHTT